MSVISVRARSFILALFIRDDGERFLLGDRGFDFKDSQLHFSANTIENDEVEKQGVDGVMLAGQVRRASVQSFDGYVGDGTTLKEEVEQMRRDFIAFFAKGHHFRVIYIDCNRNAWQRKGGYLVDAPEVKELWQIHPEYHVGLNFEDVNYYEYDENAEGEEILSNIISVPISSDVEGGLVWDENGAVSEPEEIEYDTETATASGNPISIADAVQAPLKSLEIQGNTTQQTYSGKNLYNDSTARHVYLNANGSEDSNIVWLTSTFIAVRGSTTYTWSGSIKTGQTRPQILIAEFDSSQNIILGTHHQYNDTSSKSFTTTATTAYVKVCYNSERQEKMQLEIGSTATTFEPYVGGTASPNPDYPQAVKTVTGENTLTISDGTNTQSYEVNLGKNLAKMANGAYSYSEAGQTFTLLDGSITTTRTNGSYQGGAINISTGALNRWTKFCASDSHLTGSGGTYTLTFSRTGDVVVSASSSRACIYGFIYDNDGNNTSGNGQLLVDLSGQTSGTYTFNLAADRHLGALVFYSQYISYSDVEFKVQLEKGSTPTSYAAYFTPIELCKIGDYQDSIYRSGGKWYVRKETNKVNLDGSTEGTWWYENEHGHERFIVTYPDIATQSPYAASTPKIQFSNHFEGSNGYHTYTGDMNNIMSGHHNNHQIIIRSTQFTSLAAFTSWLGTNKPSMYYVKATPTDTEITNEALIAQLEAILLQGYTYAGTNNITTIISAGNAQGELEITYYTKYDAKVVGGGYVWEAGGSGGPTIVTNESISAVSPVWTVFGPALNPMLENTTTGEQIQYVGMISEGQTLVVDMGEQTASLDGLNVISNIVGEYLTLAPGSNTLLFSADSDAPASEIGWSEIVG